MKNWIKPRMTTILVLGLSVVLALALACTSQLGTPEAPGPAPGGVAPLPEAEQASLRAAALAGFPTSAQPGIWVSGQGKASATPIWQS